MIDPQKVRNIEIFFFNKNDTKKYEKCNIICKQEWVEDFWSKSLANAVKKNKTQRSSCSHCPQKVNVMPGWEGAVSSWLLDGFPSKCK